MKNILITYLVCCTIIFLQISCKKTETSPTRDVPVEQPLAPPQPVMMEEIIYVSASFPGCVLSSVNEEEIGSYISTYFVRNGTILWECLSKPEMAPPPLIEFPNASNTTVSQLTKGTYVFEVTYRTKVATKKTTATVIVVDDGMPNGSLVLPGKEWRKENWSSFPDDHYWIYMLDISDRPDLFCYRQGKKLKVEIRDALHNAWKEIHNENSGEIDDASPNPTFYTLAYANLGIQYDPNAKQDSVMNRLVQEKAILRLSY